LEIESSPSTDIRPAPWSRSAHPVLPATAVEVDPEARLAISGGGATWSDFDAATQAHGLVTPGGVVGSTGVTGLTLGGGIGHLTAQFGLTCDNLIAAELVTPAGEVVRANGDDEAELLWGCAAAVATSVW
jgi:FAD/FMN-containing dehydrogenase